MKKAIVPIFGIVLIVGMVLQVKSFDVKAMGQFNQPKMAGSNSLATSAGVPAHIAAEGWMVTYPGAKVTVGTDMAGTITRLPVEEKWHVEKGQVIAEIRADDVRASIVQSEAALNQVDADIALYEIEINRAQRLYDEKVGTKQALDRAQRDRDAAIARRRTAQADIDRLKAQLAKSVIIAPISGEVTEKLVQQGETLKEQAPILTITDVNRVRIEAEVDEFDSAHVKVGAPVTVKAEGFTGKTWKGRVEEIPYTVVPRRIKPEDPGKPGDTRVLMVKIALLEKTPLKIGQRVEVEIGQK